MSRVWLVLTAVCAAAVAALCFWYRKERGVRHKPLVEDFRYR